MLGRGREPPAARAIAGVARPLLAMALGTLLVLIACGAHDGRAGAERPRPAERASASGSSVGALPPAAAPRAAANPGPPEALEAPGGAPIDAVAGASGAAASIGSGASGGADERADGTDAGPPDAAAPGAAPLSRAVVRFEQPFRLDRRVVPQSPDAWKATIRELRAWNDGGYGTLLAEPPGPIGHPDPRIIVNVEQARGALDAKSVERIARQYHWIQVVRCYRLGAYANAELRGSTRASFVIGRTGKVGRRTMRTTDLADEAVARCIVDRLGELSFPGRGRSTTVELMVKVGPGDEPMPPPDDRIVAGAGELTAAEMAGPVLAATGRFAACLEAAASYAPELWGRMELRFHLTAQGVLDEVFDAVGRFPDRRVSQCVLREARRLKFGRPQQGELRFIVPLRLALGRAKPPAGPPVVSLLSPDPASP